MSSLSLSLPSVLSPVYLSGPPLPPVHPVPSHGICTSVPDYRDESNHRGGSIHKNMMTDLPLVMAEEITNSMRNCGVTKIEDLRPEMVGPAGPWVGQNMPPWKR
jgi:hypothetical protein